MPHPVKFFTSAMTGAPILSNNWGDLVGLLDACLVTGFNLKTLDSITFASGLATATVSGGHGYKIDQVIKIIGADQAAYNGEQRVVGITASTFTFAVAGTPTTPATSQSGISARVAPLGWEKASFSSGNKAAYRSTDPQSNRHWLRVDDGMKANTAPYNEYNTAWAKWANVGICESMGDIDTITGAQAPFDPNNPEQNWKQRTNNQWGWYKWVYARTDGYESFGDGGAGARNWVLVGDGRIFFLFNTAQQGFRWYGRSFYCFGEPISYKPGDAYSTMLCADDLFDSNTSASWQGQHNGFGLIQSLDVASKVMLRNHTQLGNPVRWGVGSLNTNNGQQICGRGTMPFPNGADYGLWMLPAYIRQEDGHWRGLMPGMRWLPQDRPYADMTIIDNVVGEPDKKFLLLRTQYAGDAEGAQVGFDITGPWR